MSNKVDAGNGRVLENIPEQGKCYGINDFKSTNTTASQK